MSTCFEVVMLISLLYKETAIVHIYEYCPCCFKKMVQKVNYLLHHFFLLFLAWFTFMWRNMH